jgi:hypothetical protein
MVAFQLTSKTLRRAAIVQKKIEDLQIQLDALFESEKYDGTARKSQLPSRKATRRQTTISVPPVKGSGPLTPAVHRVLAEAGTSLKTAGIYDALVAERFKFPFDEPKKNLGIRLYKMAGVKPLGKGLFVLK